MSRTKHFWPVRRWLHFGLAATLAFVVACARPTAPLPDVPRLEPTPAPTLMLPADAGPHDALTEWWYYTGHLHFRQGDAFTSFPLDVDGWTLGTVSGADVIQAAMEPGPGVDPAFEVRLSLTDEKPPALHHGGYIEYGPAGGSYYYSRTRLRVSGSLSESGRGASAVSGEAWMDHQWGNFVVAPGGGWDWYSLQLDDRTELMLYVLRGPNGATTGVYGTQVLADGSLIDLQPGAVSAEATGHWLSPHTGAEYPSGWRLRLPDGSQLQLLPQLVDQELYFPVVGGQWSVVGSETSAARVTAYWEGTVRVSGDRTGVGYVELTGYAAANGPPTTDH